MLGTISYMSPEQAQGKPVDSRSDIFSFGSVLYEMLTGRRAFRQDSTVGTLAAILHTDPTPPAPPARAASHGRWWLPRARPGRCWRTRFCASCLARAHPG